MHKPSLSAIASFAAALLASTGMPRAGKHLAAPPRFIPRPRSFRIRHSKYAPRPAIVKNPKVAAQMNAMHEAWAGRFPANFMKLEPDPNSITSIKRATGKPRHLIRRELGIERPAKRKAA